MSEAEIIVSVMEKRLSFAGMSVSAMEMNASLKETIASVSTKVRSEVQKDLPPLPQDFSREDIYSSNAHAKCQRVLECLRQARLGAGWLRVVHRRDRATVALDRTPDPRSVLTRMRFSVNGNGSWLLIG